VTGSCRNRRLVAFSDAARIAGAERQLGVLLEHLAPDIDVTVAGPHAPTIGWIAAQRAGTRAVVSPPLATKRDLANLVAFRRLLVRIDPAVVHLNKTEVAALRYVEAVALTVTDTRVVSVVHHVEPPATAGGRWMARRLARRASAVVAVGPRLARQLEAILGLPADGVTPIPNRLPPLALERQVRAVDLAQGGPLVVGTLSRLVAHKALDDLVSAVGRIDNTRLILGGDGPERQRLETLAADLGIADRVEFLGWVEPGAVLEHCHLLASASHIDGHPLTLLDARSAGIPIVATDVGSVAHIVDHERTGLLVAPHDPSALAGAIDRLRRAPDLLASMEAASLATAAAPGHDGGPEQMAMSYEHLYWPLDQASRPHAAASDRS